MTTSTTTAVPSAISQRTGSSSAATGKSGSGFQAVVTPGLAATQLNANFGKTPLEQPHVIDMMKACYKINGTEEISDALNSLIDGLVKKVESGGGQKAEELKSMIVDMLKRTDPVPVSSTSSPDTTTVASSISTAKPSSAASTLTNPVPLAKPETSTKPASSWLRWLGSFFSAAPDQAAALNALQQAAVREGILEQLIEHKEELQEAKQNDTVKQEISETVDRIKKLADLNALEEELNSTESIVKLLAETTSAEKKSLVEDLRTTDLSNRKNDKFVTDQRIQNWSNRMTDQRAKHDAAIPGYKKLQAKLVKSLNNSVIPVLDPEVDLSSAKLSALSQRITELKNSESDRLPDLEARWNVARDAGNIEELNSLGDQIIACKKNIENSEKQKEKIVELQKLVSSADLDCRAIHELNLQFEVTRNNANLLPFSLHMLGNGVQSPSVNDGFSLNQALRYGGSGRSNHAMSRSIALRTHLAEFGSDFNVYENSKNPTPGTVRGDRRSFLSDLGGALRSPDSERADKTLAFLSTKEGRKYVHRLAACNVTAAGFNAKTLQLDAPSLAYKVESGFGSFKKLMIGRTGVYARDPGEYVGNRLSVLSRLSSTLQKELFRDGKPLGLEHAVLTPQHAVEASSLILAALPNDLLTANHVEVTRFMKSLKEFEGEVQSAEKEDKPVNAEKLHRFKQTIKEFHNTAASWISEREVSGADKSLAVARQISLEIAANGRKGLFRRASASVGNFVNLAGGRAIREGWSSLQNYLSQIKQKERLRQQFQRPENIALIADLKRQLLPFTESKNESDVKNAQAMLTYLSGKSLTVEIKGELSSQLQKTLLATGNFLQAVWSPLSKGGVLPKVVGLSSVQTNSIPNYSKTNLSKFAADMSSETSVEPFASTVTASTATVSPAPAGGQPPVSDNQWISNLWGQVLNEGGNPTQQLAEQQLAQLKVDYQEAFQVDYPEGGPAFSDEQVETYLKNLESLNEIALFAGQDIKNISASTLEKMKDLMPTLLKIRRGALLQGQLAPLDTRVLQNVSDNQNRCWLRSSWGAAVNALSKEEFKNRVGKVAQTLDGELGARNLNLNEIGQIYDQIKANPFNGSRANPILENKQRALMIRLMDRAGASWKKGNALETLNRLKKGENPQAEGDFGVLFFQALGLPVIIHNGAGTIPDVYLPENYKTDQHGHPDTWPTLRYDGTGLAGHWQFYRKPTVA